MGDVFAGFVVDDADVFTGLDQLRDALERDIAAGLGVVELSVRVALDQHAHRGFLAS